MLSAIFVGGIALPLAGQFSGASAALDEKTENRRAAPLPEIEFKQIGPLPFPRTRSLVEFPEKYEAYYNDHFGFRRDLVRYYNLARLYGVAPEVLTSPTVGVKQGSPVVVGRNGWLFFNGGYAIDTYRGSMLFSQEQLDAWTAMLTRRRDWLAERGIEYVLVFAPEKSTIYPELLPRSLNRVGSTTRMDQLLDRLRSTDSGVQIVDLRSTLIEGKSQFPTYYSTDTHWNDFGAFLGYQQMMRAIFPAVEPWELNNFDVQSTPCGGRDMANMLDSPVELHDTFLDLRPKRPRGAVMQQVAAEAGARECRRSVHLSAPIDRAVVLHDSFFVALFPFFNEHFQQVDYYWMYELPREQIERDRPRFVVQEMVERCLLFYDPQADK